jgi:hypothetical protein
MIDRAILRLTSCKRLPELCSCAGMHVYLEKERFCSQVVLHWKTFSEKAVFISVPVACLTDAFSAQSSHQV